MRTNPPAVDDSWKLPAGRRSRNRAKWCKRTTDHEHVPGIRLDRYWESRQRFELVALGHSGHRTGPALAVCGWSTWSVWRRGQRVPKSAYRCAHRRVCTACGYVVERRLRMTECPDYQPRCA